MKFLCVPCNEPMKLRRTAGPDDGSMTVVFGCPECDREIAMLTNSMETQMVRALDVKMGGRSVPAEPMSVIKESLTGAREDVFESPSGDATEEGPSSASKCPFSGAVAEAYEKAETTGLRWTADAEERIDRVPSFIRPMVRKGIEDYASELGYSEIDVAIMEEVRDRIGM